MSKLSDEVKGLITDIRPGIIATTSRDGKPNVSAKGSFRVIDDDHIVFIDMSSPRTVANIKDNPQVSILIMHPKTFKGCRIWGKGEVLNAGELFDQISSEYTARDTKINHVVRITVDEIQEGI